MEEREGGKGGLASGWILVTGVLLLCVSGTGLTWWNYSRQVFSTADGIVVASQFPESLIAVHLPLKEAKIICIGHGARISVGAETTSFQGRVVSIDFGKGSSEGTVILRLAATPLNAQGEKTKLPHGLPSGTKCSVTIDTTVPPLEKPSAGAVLQ